MFGISGFELFLILAVGLLIFGPDEMPRIGRIIGQALRMFNDARQEVQDVITTEILTPEDAQMLKDPFGMKGMQRDLQTTMKQLADPDYKPIPKGAGMRVATDDLLDAPGAQTEDAHKSPQDAGADTLTTPLNSGEDLHGGPERVTVEIDATDAASIWGATAGPVEVSLSDEPPTTDATTSPDELSITDATASSESEDAHAH